MNYFHTESKSRKKIIFRGWGWQAGGGMYVCVCFDGWGGGRGGGGGWRVDGWTDERPKPICKSTSSPSNYVNKCFEGHFFSKTTTVQNYFEIHE